MVEQTATGPAGLVDPQALLQAAEVPVHHKARHLNIVSEDAQPHPAESKAPLEQAEAVPTDKKPVERISLLAHFLNSLAGFLQVVTYEVVLQLLTYLFGILGAVLVCCSPSFPNPFSSLAERFKQYAIRRSFLRKLFKSYLQDVKLKASHELKAHDKQR